MSIDNDLRMQGIADFQKSISTKGGAHPLLPVEGEDFVVSSVERLRWGWKIL